MVGGSFTAATSTLKVVEERARPSLTLRVMLALPQRFVAGTIVTVRFAPDPFTTMFPFGIKIGLEEEPLTDRSAAELSASLTVKEIGPTGVSSSVF